MFQEERKYRDVAMSVILLIENRLFLRNCLHDCFDRSFPDHDIVGFGTLAEWCNYIEEKTLNPAVVIYFASAGISPILKSEFGRIEALSPNTRIIVISDATGSDEINQVIGYGARGYIPTSMPTVLPSRPCASSRVEASRASSSSRQPPSQWRFARPAGDC